MKLVYSNGSGAVNLGVGDMPVSSYDLPFQCEGLFYDDQHDHYVKFIGGGHSLMSDSEKGAVASYLSSIPAQPGSQYEWTSTGWQIPSGALESAKAIRWQIMKSVRDAKLSAGLTFNGGVYDSDDTSRSYIQGAVQLAQIAAANNQAYSVVWTLADNSTATLTGTQMMQLGVALGQFVQTVFAEGDSIRAQINAATTVDQVNAILWT